ncbi:MULTISPECIES: hypothetical protein [Enterobacter]|uniref:hypothetical protein n=1 Tax=Enterobacter TaxID=547 RepID=UPI001F1CCB0F|nr:hypothetical protein [Enterobacter quasiroggenkampii]
MNETLIPVDTDLLRALQSDYLAEGYKKDSVYLARLKSSANQCTGLFKITDAYPPSDGIFHLSMTTVTNCISQLGIVYAGLLNGLKKKCSEVYVMEYNIRFLRPINELEFTITAAMSQSRRKARGIIYTMKGEVQQGAFCYEVIFLFPIAEAI